MKEKRRVPLGYYVLPNLFTTASMFSGFLAILWAISGKFFLSAVAILVSCIFDGLDGKIARLTKANSDFGIQMDSLADLVAFGMAPAIVVYLWQLNVFGRLGIAISFMFLACGALRLARFNLIAMRKDAYDPKFFMGLPIPAAASFLATFIIFHHWANLDSILSHRLIATFCMLSTLALALLMVSNIRYYSFKELSFFKARPFTSSVFVVLLFVLVGSEPYLITFIFFLCYIFSGPIYALSVKMLKKQGPLLSELENELPNKNK